jgi:branched-subunit amino acid aminotransferase/4-amino-4-deoxychorismate lyase
MSEPSAARWRDDGFEPVDACEARPVRVLAADSWLAHDGTAVALDAHRHRFLGSLPPEADGAAFWDAAVAAVPRTGDWFPRLELREVGERRELLLRMRPAPPLRRDVALVAHDGPDPRTQPLVKGPDLERLTAVRTSAQGRGGDDAVLRDAAGRIAETATASLVWWRGDALCVPDRGIPHLPGITLGAVVVLATALGVDVRHEEARPEDLDGLEIWTLNALHGIRIVTSWPGGPSPAAEPGRLTAWRRRLDALRRPLPEQVPA